MEKTVDSSTLIVVKCGCKEKTEGNKPGKVTSMKFSLIERWESINDYVKDLKDNHWNDEEIEFAIELLKKSGDVEWNADGSFIVRIC